MLAVDVSARRRPGGGDMAAVVAAASVAGAVRRQDRGKRSVGVWKPRSESPEGLREDEGEKLTEECVHGAGSA